MYSEAMKMRCFALEMRYCKTTSRLDQLTSLAGVLGGTYEERSVEVGRLVDDAHIVAARAEFRESLEGRAEVLESWMARANDEGSDGVGVVDEAPGRCTGSGRELPVRRAQAREHRV
jgi:hypothetical protein